jgi:hemolysin III
VTVRGQTTDEEFANAITHGVGAAFALAAFVFLIIAAAGQGNALHIASVSVYAATLFLMFAASAAYHSAKAEKTKFLLRTLDHSCVYLLIAGTYTPLMLISLQGVWGWTIFGIVWSAALAGIVLKFLAFRKFYAISISLYVVMGWIAIVAIKPIASRVPAGGLALLLGGGIVYTLGVVFYKQEKLRYAHMIWHLFVLAAAVLHFIAIWKYVLPTGQG